MTIAETFNLAIRGADEFTKRELFNKIGMPGPNQGELRIQFSDSSIARNTWSVKNGNIETVIDSTHKCDDFKFEGTL